MRFYQLGAFGLDNLALQTGPTPEPGPGEVRVRVKALSLNFRDLLLVNGLYNPKLPLPAVPISDGAGTIAAVGPEVDGREAGHESRSDRQFRQPIFYPCAG